MHRAQDYTRDIHDVKGRTGGDAFFKDGEETSQEEGWKSGVGTVEGVWAGYVEEPDAKGWSKEYQTVAEFEKRDDILTIRKEDIKPEERERDVPDQGYVWVD